MNKLEKKKILIIEDDPILLQNIKEMLEEENFEVKTESDGESGFKTACEWLPNLIICDIAMPVKDGYEVLNDVLTCPKTRSIPFIFLTSKVGKEDLRKGMQLGADDYIFKPFDLDDLLMSVRMRLEKSILRKEGEPAGDGVKVYEIDDKIMIKTGCRMALYPVKEIKYLRSRNPYVLLKFSDGKISLQRETMEEWEKKLPSKYFIRIHRSTIINSQHITKIDRHSNSSFIIYLKDEGDPFYVSKRHAQILRDRF